MTTDLSPADQADRRRLTAAHLDAASGLGCSLDQGWQWDWHDRSVSGRGTRDGQRVWIRTVTKQPHWHERLSWAGNLAANNIVGVPKPIVLDSTQTRDEDRWFRTEVMTLVEQAPASPTPAVTTPPCIDERWLDHLRTSLDALAVVSTSRKVKGQDDVTQQLCEYFGDRIDPQIERWVTSHGDLHWANLTAPELVVLGWEKWGIAPYGYDIATLYCHSLMVPDTAAAIHRHFVEVLECADGIRSQLLAASHILGRTGTGNYTDMVVPLHHLTDRLLGR